MNTMTYAVAAVRGDSAERDNELPVYYRKRKLMKVQHFLQTSALIISKHRWLAAAEMLPLSAMETNASTKARSRKALMRRLHNRYN